MCNLFDKYKPKNLKDFMIDDKTRQLLNVFIDIDSLNLLIIGDTGTGKSSLIDVLINEYYKSKYKKDNVMYINLLKEQGIHHFRQNIKTFCQITNNIQQKKIVVIDNIDQINEQSQPDITLTRGSTYTFYLLTTGHPFRIQSSTGTSETLLYNNGLSYPDIHFNVLTGVNAQGKESGIFTALPSLDRCPVRQKILI